MLRGLESLGEGQQVMFKLTIPSKTNLYQELVNHPKVVRVVALSGGYPVDQANELLAQNHGIIASFSRALVQDLNVEQSDKEFNESLGQAIESIYQASIK